jgi:hypothetical protein
MECVNLDYHKFCDLEYAFPSQKRGTDRAHSRVQRQTAEEAPSVEKYGQTLRELSVTVRNDEVIAGGRPETLVRFG